MSKNSSLTPGEFEILHLIMTSDFTDGEGAERIDHPVWTVAETPVQKGNLSSCIKKNFVGNDNQAKGDEIVWITSEGYNMYLSYLSTSSNSK